MKTTKQMVLTDAQIENFIRTEFPDDFKEEHSFLKGDQQIKFINFSRLNIEHRQNFDNLKVNRIFQTGCVYNYYMSWNKQRDRWIQIPTHWRATTVYQPLMYGIIRDIVAYPAQGVIDNLKRVEANLLCLCEYRGDVSADRLKEMMRKEKMYLYLISNPDNDGKKN
ncbi:MAG TPA: hypothetical protein VGO45_14590 [Bacteroidia bacterium]|jgi:hypothetical protein|nr:hypothetical protein [Bacteroidia bacterium]